jgi:beta-galactosidase
LRPTNKTDLATLRWAVRSDGHRGFVFVNNYQRLQPMPPQKNVQFKLNLPGGEFVFPSKPVTIPADSFFIWPFNLDLGGVKLVYATAQPVCRIDNGGVHTFFFAEIPGMPAEFAFGPTNVVMTWLGKISHPNGLTVVSGLKPDRHGYAVRASYTLATNEIWEIVLLNEADSLALWKAGAGGGEKVFLTRAGLSADEGKIKLTSDAPADFGLEIYPKTNRTTIRADGIFKGVDLPKPKAVSMKAGIKPVKSAGPPREIPLSTGKSHIALAPAESDFTNAAVWKITLPAGLDLKLDPILRIHYVGDIARVTLNGKLIDDNFYNGKTFDLGLKRYRILDGDLRLEILPLRKDAPIYLADEAKPDFGKAASIATVNKLEIISRFPAEFKP